MLFIPVFVLHLFCSYFDCSLTNPQPTIPSIEKDSANGDYIFAKAEDTLVYTKNGAVQGFIEKVISGRSIYAFEGIPYAEKPIRDLQFKVLIYVTIIQ